MSIEAIALEEEALIIVAPEAEEIRFVARWGQVVKFCAGSPARYDITGGEGYVRAECYGHGRQAAWTQPIFVD